MVTTTLLMLISALGLEKLLYIALAVYVGYIVMDFVFGFVVYCRKEKEREESL